MNGDAPHQIDEGFQAKLNGDAPHEEIDLQGVSMSYYQEMKDIFKIFDADGSGAIDPKEIREQMISLGFEVDNTTIYQLISDLDSDGSQKIEFDEFFGMLRDTLEIHKPSFNSRQTFLEIFDFLDDLEPKNRDGKIDVSNLRRLANVLGDNIPDTEIELMVQGADPDGKGYVLPEEFYQLMIGCATKMEQDEASRDDAYSDSNSLISPKSGASDSSQDFKKHRSSRSSLAKIQRTNRASLLLHPNVDNRVDGGKKHSRVRSTSASAAEDVVDAQPRQTHRNKTDSLLTGSSSLDGLDLVPETTEETDSLGEP